jgi:small subunit ribosomal protein S20
MMFYDKDTRSRNVNFVTGLIVSNLEVLLAAKHSSAEKRYRQSEARRLRNKAVKTESRTYARKYVEAVHTKDAAASASALKTLVKALDTAGGKGILSKKAVSRKKSRMMRLYSVTFGVTGHASSTEAEA